MNRITKEYYKRLRPLMLMRYTPRGFSSNYNAECHIKHELRKLAEQFTNESRNNFCNPRYFKREDWYSYSYDKHERFNFLPEPIKIHTGKVIVVDGSYIPETILCKTTSFRAIINHHFRTQANNRIKKLNARLGQFMEKEAYGHSKANKVYFMQDNETGEIKIGVSHKPERRLLAIQNQRQHPITLLAVIDGGYAKEKELHKRYAELRTNGEWFFPCPDMYVVMKNS